MLPMPIGDLNAIADELAETGGRVRVLWQRPESLAFVARGREYRSEFHICLLYTSPSPRDRG